MKVAVHHRRLSAAMGVVAILLIYAAVPAAAAPKNGTGSASCSCYCKSKTSEGIVVALPKSLKAPNGDVTQCDKLAGIACKNTIPEDVSYGTLSLCQGLAESRRPSTRTPGKLPLHTLEQAQ
jgi:hypothetical protein